MSTKRKLAEAFQALDAAVDPAPPAKRPEHRTVPIRDPRQIWCQSTPHLTAVLARAAARTRKALPFSHSVPPTLPQTAEYRPSSVSSFLARLATFKLATYSLKPSQIDSVAAAKCGWVNEGKDRLVCGLCRVSWVVAGRDGMSKEAANALVEKQRTSLVQSHKDGCPWKTRQCDASIYCVPLQAPSAMVRDLKNNALILDPILRQIQVQHPLSANQLAFLRSTVHDFKMPNLEEEEDISVPQQPSDPALLAALFGWAPTPPSTEQRYSSISRPASRAGSPFPSRPSLSTLPTTRASTPTHGVASTPPSTPPRQFLRRISSTVSLASPTRQVTTLHCALCQRRIGLWAFAPPTEPSTPPLANARPPAPRRQLDLHKEHRSFCPYVVRSTPLASLPADTTPTDGVMEGWRAVLNVVRRYGSVQRQRAVSLRRKQGLVSTEAEGDEALDSVEAMVSTVKRQGGQNLLSYVKGLLG
ncbi:C3HC zinc finger-like-domain-containing protein [Mycena amicta]|nr:C3HC zinc finger-like-domain-containing protein [Mycena amicta]